jgi:hypothetical protein
MVRSKRIVGLLKVALGEYDFVGCCPSTQSDLQATWDDGLRSGGGAGLYQALVNQILELRPAHFEAVGTGVRQIVSDVVDIRLLRVHSASSTVQGSNHFLTPSVLLFPARRSKGCLVMR